MSTISYDDFAKLEIRIGEVTAVDIVEDADKLLALTVDFGDETPRQIISGIREYVEPQELIGKRFPFLTNLEHRTIRGRVSEGMILAASAGDTLALLAPTASVPPGTRIS